MVLLHLSFHSADRYCGLCGQLLMYSVSVLLFVDITITALLCKLMGILCINVFWRKLLSNIKRSIMHIRLLL